MTHSPSKGLPESTTNGDVIELQIIEESNPIPTELQLDQGQDETMSNQEVIPRDIADEQPARRRPRPIRFTSALTVPRALDQLSSKELDYDPRPGTSTTAHMYCTVKRSKYSTLRMKNAAMCRGRDCLDQKAVVDNISSDPELNQPSPESEQLRMELIRDLHCSLPCKRHLKRNVSQHLGQLKRIVRGPSMRFRIRQGFRVVKTKVREGFQYIDLWHGQLRAVEGRFGSSTAYYFRFLQLLVFLNLITFVLSASFILLPQLLWRFDDNEQPWTASAVMTNNGTPSVTTSPTYGPARNQRRLQSVQQKSYNFDLKSYSLIDLSDEDEADDDREFKWTDLLTGSGYLESTELYYGAYVNFTIEVSPNYYYNLPMAYLLSTVCHLCLCLILLAKWVASAYKHHITVHCGYGEHTFCNMVFCSWDFGITSVEAARFKMDGITRKFQEKVKYLRKNESKMTCCQRLEKYCRIIINHIVVIAILAASGAVTWFLLKSNPFQVDIPILSDLSLPLIITGILIVIPFTFSLLIRYEGYQSKGTKVYITILRMMVLLMTLLGVLCYFWFGTSYESIKEGRDTCWETELGEEIYRLLLVDFVVVTILSLFVGFFHTFALRQRIFENPKFNLAWNTWNLIYTQMLCWLGSFYFPMISGIVIIKLLLTFYIKQVHLRVNCTPPNKPWGATQLRIVFLSYAFMGLVAMLIPVGYSIIAMMPSQQCGPFRGRETVYAVIFDTMETWHINSAVFRKLAHFISLPGCVAGILIVLCAIAFQIRSRAVANRYLVERMQQQLQLEKKDKAFLLRLLDGAFTALQAKSDNTGDLNPMASKFVFRGRPNTAENGHTNTAQLRRSWSNQASTSLSENSVFDFSHNNNNNNSNNNNNNAAYLSTHGSRHHTVT